MKKLLYLIIPLIVGCTKCPIKCVDVEGTYTIKKYDAGKKDTIDFPTDVKRQICYIDKQYVVILPEAVSNRQSFENELKKRKMYLIDKCPCSDRLQLWGSVNPVPDGGSQDGKGSGSSNTGETIVRNIIGKFIILHKKKTVSQEIPSFFMLL